MHWNAIRKRLFFTDAPAQGAFYALTQLLLGSYLVFSLFVFLLGISWVTITMPAVWIAAGVVTVLFCYYLVMTLTFFRSQQSGLLRYSSFPVFLNCSRESREVPEFIVPTLIEKNTNFFG